MWDVLHKPVRAQRTEPPAAPVSRVVQTGEHPTDTFVRENKQLTAWLTAHRNASFIQKMNAIGTFAPDPRPVARPALTVTTVNCFTSQGRSRNDPLPLLERALGTGSDVVVAPEWLFLPGRDHAAFRKTIGSVVAMTQGWSGLLLPGTMALVDQRDRYRNVAFAIADGRVLHTYAKREDGDDAELAKTLGTPGSPVRWVPGERAGLFRWRGLWVGMEICLDHSVGRLRCDIAENPTPPLALQLVSACGADVNRRAHAVGVGGVVVLVDGVTGSHSRRNGAYLRDANAIGRLQDEVISIAPGFGLGVTHVPPSHAS